MEIHDCHANGCVDNAHPEMPFCKRHSNMLPPPHKKALWAERRMDGVCGACSTAGEETAYARSERWDELFNLGVAILLVVEYDECGGGPEVHDAEGFCWGCGVADAERTYARAGKAVEKFQLKRVA